MRNDLRLATLALLAFGFTDAGPASAGPIYATGFENPPFAPGSQLLGQDGWTTAIPAFLNPAAAIVTNTIALRGTQSLEVSGTDLFSSGGITAPYEAVGSYRRPVNFDVAAAGFPTIQLRADVRLNGPLVGPGDLFAASLAARSGDGGVGELALSSDGRVYGYTGNFGSPILLGVAVDLGAWHQLGIDVDFRDDSYTFLLDGVPLGRFPFEPGFTSDVLLRGALVTYAYPDDGAAGYQRSDFTARFDNFSINTVIPEPGTALLLGVGAIAAAGLGRAGVKPRSNRG